MVAILLTKIICIPRGKPEEVTAIVSEHVVENGIDIVERSQNIIIKSNKMYHINDKGISVGQNSTVNIENNLFVSCDKGIAIKDSSYALIFNH